MTEEQFKALASEILGGPVRWHTGLGKGCYCHCGEQGKGEIDYECGDCAISKAIEATLRAVAEQVGKERDAEPTTKCWGCESVIPIKTTPVFCSNCLTKCREQQREQDAQLLRDLRDALKALNIDGCNVWDSWMDDDGTLHRRADERLAALRSGAVK